MFGFDDPTPRNLASKPRAFCNLVISCRMSAIKKYEVATSFVAGQHCEMTIRCSQNISMLRLPWVLLARLSDSTSKAPPHLRANCFGITINSMSPPIKKMTNPE